MKPKGKYLDGTPIFYLDLDEPPADDLITDDEWDHARYIINRTLEDFELHPTEAVEHYSVMGLPFLGWFKASLNCRAIRQNRSFAPHEESEPTLGALGALKALQDLLKDNGGINPEKAKIFLHSFALMINVLRSGAIPGAFSRSEKVMDGSKDGGDKSAEVRKKKARSATEVEQAEADKEWRKHPTWGKPSIAKKVAEKIGGKPGTIRKHIKKPLKKPLP